MSVPHHYHPPPAIVMQVGDERPVPLTERLRKEYERLYTRQVANLRYAKALEAGLLKILSNVSRYKEVEERAKVPWYVVGVVHLLESNCSFNYHLHNGDPIGKKTTHVPKGRPNLDSWTWEDSAVDALEWERQVSWAARGLDPKDWSLPAILYRLEAWNGFGSRVHGVPTAFLWSGTTFYKQGKYGSDGKWNSKLVSQQVGAASLLKALEKRSVIKIHK